MCFPVEWLLQLLLMLVIVVGVVKILQIWVFPGIAAADPRITATINIIIWVLICCFVIYVCGMLLFCAFSGGFSLFPHR